MWNSNSKRLTVKKFFRIPKIASVFVVDFSAFEWTACYRLYKQRELVSHYVYHFYDPISHLILHYGRSLENPVIRRRSMTKKKNRGEPAMFSQSSFTYLGSGSHMYHPKTPTTFLHILLFWFKHKSQIHIHIWGRNHKYEKLIYLTTSFHYCEESSNNINILVAKFLLRACSTL